MGITFNGDSASDISEEESSDAASMGSSSDSLDEEFEAMDGIFYLVSTIVGDLYTNEERARRLLDAVLFALAHPFEIDIDGNIGAGKSTLAAALAAWIEKTIGKVRHLPEQINMKFLDRYYKDPVRLASFMQCLTITKVVKQIEMAKVWATYEQVITIIERAAGNRVFMQDHFDKGNIDEVVYHAYLEEYEDGVLHNQDAKDLPVVVLNLGVTPEECWNRMNKRGRKAEEGLPLEFFQGLDTIYHTVMVDYAKNCERCCGVLCIDNSELLTSDDQLAELFIVMCDLVKARAAAGDEETVERVATEKDMHNLTGTYSWEDIKTRGQSLQCTE